jgi:hypothetical protein
VETVLKRIAAIRIQPDSMLRILITNIWNNQKNDLCMRFYTNIFRTVSESSSRRKGFCMNPLILIRRCFLWQRYIKDDFASQEDFASKLRGFYGSFSHEITLRIKKPAVFV